MGMGGSLVLGAGVWLTELLWYMMVVGVVVGLVVVCVVVGFVDGVLSLGGVCV